MESTGAASSSFLKDEDLQTIVKALGSGASIAATTNMSAETLEGLYTLGYNLYTAGNYADAETMFRALCVYKHNEPRFWTGLAGSLQGQEKYVEAIDAYSMAGASASLSDPQPFMFAANCFMKLGDKENAIGALEGLLTLGDDANPAHAACKGNARELLRMLKGN